MKRELDSSLTREFLKRIYFNERVELGQRVLIASFLVLAVGGARSWNCEGLGRRVGGVCWRSGFVGVDCVGRDIEIIVL